MIKGVPRRGRYYAMTSVAPDFDVIEGSMDFGPWNLDFALTTDPLTTIAHTKTA